MGSQDDTKYILIAEQTHMREFLPISSTFFFLQGEKRRGKGGAEMSAYSLTDVTWEIVELRIREKSKEGEMEEDYDLRMNRQKKILACFA